MVDGSNNIWVNGDTSNALLAMWDSTWPASPLQANRKPRDRDLNADDRDSRVANDVRMGRI